MDDGDGHICFHQFNVVLPLFFFLRIVVYIYLRSHSYSNMLPNLLSSRCHVTNDVEFIAHKTCRRIRVRRVYVNRLNGVWRIFSCLLLLLLSNMHTILYSILHTYAYLFMLRWKCMREYRCGPRNRGRMLNYAPTRRARASKLTNKF